MNKELPDEVIEEMKQFVKELKESGLKLLSIKIGLGLMPATKKYIDSLSQNITNIESDEDRALRLLQEQKQNQFKNIGKALVKEVNSCVTNKDIEQ